MKTVVVTFPDGREVECYCHDGMTDEENIREWTQGWTAGSSGPAVIPVKVEIK